MARFAFLFISIWVLLVAPTLCVGGVLFHVCACEVDACGRADELFRVAPCESGSDLLEHERNDACAHEDDACGHEESCSAAPCQDMVRTLSARADLESEVAPPLCVPAPAFLAELQPCSTGVPLPATAEDRAVHRPLAERFRPLLN